MKRLVILVILVVALTLGCATTGITPLGSVTEKEDDMTGNRYIIQRIVANNVFSDKYIKFVYAMPKNGKEFIYVDFTFFLSDWIFADTVEIKADNYYKKFTDVKHDRDVMYGGNVSESLTLHDISIEQIKALANAENVKIRLSGKYSESVELSQGNKDDIKEWIDHVSSL